MGVIFRQSVKGTLVTYVGAFIGFLTTFFVSTKYLSAEEIGLTRVLFEAALLLSTFAVLGVNTSAVRYYPYFKTKEGTENGFFRFVLLFPLLGVVLFSIAYLLFREPIVALFEKKSRLFTQYYLLVLPLMVFLMYQTVLEVYCSVKQRIVWPRFHREITQRLLLILVYLTYAFLNISLTRFIYAFVLSYAVVVALDFAYAWRIGGKQIHEPIRFPKEQGKDFRNYTILLLLSSLGGSIVSRLDLFMVSAKMGLDYAGIFSIAFFIVAIIDIPSRSILAISAPFASEALKEGNLQDLRKLYQNLALYQLLVGGFLFVLIWVNIDFVFQVIPNSSVYVRGKWVVFFLGLAKVVELTFNYGNAVVRYSQYYYYSIAISFLLTALTILSNLFFIPRYGMAGAAIATLVTALVSYSISQLIIGWKIKITPFTKRLGILFILLSLLLLSNFSFLSLFRNIWLNAIVKTIIFVLLPLVLLLSSGFVPELRDWVQQSKRMKWPW